MILCIPAGENLKTGDNISMKNGKMYHATGHSFYTLNKDILAGEDVRLVIDDPKIRPGFRTYLPFGEK